MRLLAKLILSLMQVRPRPFFKSLPNAKNKKKTSQVESRHAARGGFWVI